MRAAVDGERSRRDESLRRSENDPHGLTRRWRAVAFVGGAFAVSALFRCLHRTSELARQSAQIADLARQTEQLADLARTDPLTGLPNRRHLEEHLAALVSAARRYDHPLSVLFIDIDNFKQVNDEMGYEQGDEVLREVGERLRVTVRAEDLVGRWGGEEFVAVLPMTGSAGAVGLAERLRSAIACAPVVTPAAEVRVTVSVGCTSGVFPATELVRQASGALRRAKRDGRNRVVATESPPL